jgi:hypothetical protein
MCRLALSFEHTAERTFLLDLGQLAAIGFGGVGGIGGQTDSGQIHLGQMGGEGRLFVGILGTAI